ncbi:MAG: AAA family ATPase, partial [bacterium]|nr:AAA family ATPase [bacterium]
MLRLLRISNFAVIDSLEVSFGPGLNVLTGETGAGKSIIFEALHLALGGRASSDLIRSGAKEALVETLFDLPDTPGGRAARTLFEEAGAAIEADGEVLVRRRISGGGRGRIYLNDAMITAATLAAGGERLVNIHGQHAQQSLLRAATHLDLLDDFAALTDDRAALTALVGELRAAEGTLDRHLHGVRERAQRSDMLRFQVEELEKAELRAGEWEEIEAEIPRLRNAERLRELAGALYEALYEAEGAVSERLGEAVRDLERLAELDPARADLAGDAASALAQVESLAESLRDYLEEMDAEPGRLEALEERRSRLLELRRKYGNDEAACLEYLAGARSELEAFADEAG